MYFAEFSIERKFLREREMTEVSMEKRERVKEEEADARRYGGDASLLMFVRRKGSA